MNAFSYRIQKIRPSLTREIMQYATDPSFISFAGSAPAAETLPSEIIREITCELLENDAVSVLGHTPAEGYKPLRDVIKDRLYSKGILNWNDDDVIITSGVHQSLDILSKLICNEGDAVICPNPCPAELMNIFRSYGARLVGVPVDSDGMSSAYLEQALTENQRTAFIYVCPDFSDPTGITMSEERRREILEIAYRHNVLIVEDASYSDLRFAGADLPSIRSMDKKGIVFYAGSYSASVAPGVSVGYLCCSGNIIPRAVCLLEGAVLHADTLSQRIIHRLLTRYDYDEYLYEVCELYRRKSDLMLNCLKYKMPSSVSFTEPDGGIFLYGTVPEGDINYFFRKALDNKILIVPGTAFTAEEGIPSLSFRINYTGVSDEEIEKGTDRLAMAAKTLYK